MRFRLIREARADLHELGVFFEGQRVGSAGRFGQEFHELMRRLLHLPQSFARAGRSPAGREIRVGFTAKLPAIIHYEVTAEEIVVISIAHAHRNRVPWRKRLGH